MPCYHPLSGHRSKATGKLLFTWSPYTETDYMLVPCGNCIGCRIDRSRAWAIRCVHEAQTHENNCFITLTYNDKNIPSGGGLRPIHLQNFFKELRRKYSSKTIRYFACGEYGDENQRPHYHACLFGLDFDDKLVHSTTNGVPLHRSPTLEKLWRKGYSTVGNVTWESAGYVARYIMKKITGEQSDSHYMNRETGELIQPEFTRMSNRPGIGKAWFDKYHLTDLYPQDFVIIGGKKYSIPRYYDKLFELEDPETMSAIKKQRENHAKEQQRLNPEHTSTDRLRVREFCKQKQLNQLKRSLENSD